jgi:hypothetical protein
MASLRVSAVLAGFVFFLAAFASTVDAHAQMNFPLSRSVASVQR